VPKLFEPIRADQRILTSLLQRAIQRGEVDLAQRAALTILKLKGPGIWRRLLVIAFADVGAGAAEVLREVTEACTDKGYRKRRGLAAVALNLAGVLAQAPKEQSAGWLLDACGQRPPAPPALIGENLSEALHDPSRSLVDRAAVAIRAAHDDGLSALMRAYLEIGAPEWLVKSTLAAANETERREVPLVPLVWLAIQSAGSSRIIRRNRLEDEPLVVDGVPMYAVDTNTRLGREAIRRFTIACGPVAAGLAKHAPPFARRHAAYLASYYADIVIKKRLIWPEAEAIHRVGMEAAFLTIGVPVETMRPLLGVFQVNVMELHRIRALLFQRNKAAN
jgi:hypothetical protein